jgi:hypothetical protein
MVRHDPERRESADQGIPGIIGNGVGKHNAERKKELTVLSPFMPVTATWKQSARRQGGRY